MVLVGISVGCLMGCFRAPPPWRKTAPSKKAHEEVYGFAALSFKSALRVMDLHANSRGRLHEWEETF